MAYKQLLKQYEEERGFPIRVGLVGGGQMGTGLISQIEKMVGIRVVALADVVPNRSVAAFHEAGVPDKLVVVEEHDPFKAGELIEEGKRIATHSADMLVNIPNLDVIVESTGIPEVGARVCHAALLAGKHTVNMNVETDIVIGHYLTKMANSAGVVYTLVTGDEPGSVKEIYDFADTLGFEVICVAKGKNNPLNPSANPDSAAAEAKTKNMSPKMLASFQDGTKTQAEMTSMANSTGYEPEVRGAHGPFAEVADLPKLFVPKEDGGILSTRRAIDYAVGKIAPGVFVTITTDQPKIIRDLNYLGVSGHGNYWALYRPYHLANLETPISIIRTVLYNEETAATHNAPVAETIAVAKKDLKAGEKIDSLGGYTVRGVIEKARVAREQNLLPLGIAPGAVLKKDIKDGQAVRWDEVEVDENQTIFHLRQLQDRMLGYK